MLPMSRPEHNGARLSHQVYVGVNKKFQHAGPWEFRPAGAGSLWQRSAQPHDGLRPCRVLCYGDSNTVGFNNGGRGNNHPYGDTLADALSSGGAIVEVGVCGLNGHTTQEFLAELEEPLLEDPSGNPGKGLVRIIEEDGPIDLIIIMLGTNDLGKGRTPMDVANDVRGLHTACHNLGVPTVALAPPIGGAQSAYTQKLRRQVLDLMPAYLEGKEGLLAYFDAEELVPRSGSGNFWQPDEIHLSASGSQLLGRRLSEWLLPVLQTAQLEAGVPIELDEPQERAHSGRRYSTSPAPARRARTMSPSRAPDAMESYRRAHTSSPIPANIGNPIAATLDIKESSSVTAFPARQSIQRAPTTSQSYSDVLTSASTKEHNLSPQATFRMPQDASVTANRPDLNKGGYVNKGGAPCSPSEHLHRERAARSLSKGPPHVSQDEPPQGSAYEAILKVGAAVEVWSNSQQVWCHGFVKKVNGIKVTAEFKLLDKPAKKVLNAYSREIRLRDF